jgi:hypothetical protein
MPRSNKTPKAGKKPDDDEMPDDTLDPDYPTEDITMADLWKLMQSIKTDTKSTMEKLTEIETRVSDIEGNNMATDGSIMGLQTNVTYLQDTVDLIKGRLIRNEITNRRLQNELSQLKAHSMKWNILFNFNKNRPDWREQTKEDSVAVVKDFLAKVMHVRGADKFYIPVAHRLGQNDGRTPRPIIATVPIAAQFDAIMSEVKSLAGTHHFVSRQLPPEKNERKQFALTGFKEARKQPNAKVKMVSENLFVGGKLDRKFLPPSIPDELAS